MNILSDGIEYISDCFAISSQLIAVILLENPRFSSGWIRKTAIFYEGLNQFRKFFTITLCGDGSITLPQEVCSIRKFVTDF
jgi:hypothetical protein